MTLPFFSLPARFKRRSLQCSLSTGIRRAIAFLVISSTPTASLAQAVNPNQNRNASSAGQVTVLPDVSAKTPSTGTQNLSLPPALSLPASSGIPAFSNFSDNPRDALSPGQTMDLIRFYQEAAFNDPVLNSARFNYAANK
jgi:outer membrane protein